MESNNIRDELNFPFRVSLFKSYKYPGRISMYSIVFMKNLLRINTVEGIYII